MHRARPSQTFLWLLPFNLAMRSKISVFLLLVTIATFWEPLAALYRLTQEQSHYSHLLLVPLVSLYVFYLHRDLILSSSESSPWSGLIMVGLGAIGYWQAGQAIHGVDYVALATLAFVVVIWGVFLLCYGQGACRHASFGLLFLLCMVPFPGSWLHTVIVFLQHSAAEAVDIGFSVLGVPVIRNDIVFGLPNITIRIDEGCSAIRSALSLFITSIVAGHFFLRSTWAKLGIVLAMVPLAIIDNGVRIVGLSLLANYVNKVFLLDSRLHDLGGYFTFALSITILIVLISALRRLERGSWFYSPVRSEVRPDVVTANEPL
jgi:exosortase